jgi:hypothetical protein
MAENMMSVQDYAAMREIERSHNKGWGFTTALWIIAAVVVLGIFIYIWQKNCNEKVQFATSIAKLDGRVDAIEPTLTAQGNNLYSLNNVVAATVQGTKDIKENVYNQLFQLNDEIFYNPGRRNAKCGGCGGREFQQQSTYNLASQTAVVTESCRN